MVTLDLSRDARESREARRRRPRTLSPRRLRREMREEARSSTILRIIDDERPQTRAECKGGPRPCLYVSCRFHLYLDVNPSTGSIKLNFPGLEPWELPETCALDIAERGGLTLEEIGALMNVTRERARQVEESGLQKMREKI
jgi:hypothetical protein